MLLADDADVGKERGQLAESIDDVASVVRIGEGGLGSTGDTESVEDIGVEAERHHVVRSGPSKVTNSRRR